MIIGPPSNPRKYLLASLARVERLSGRLSAACGRVRSAAPEGEMLLCLFLRYGGTEPETAANVLSATYFLETRFSRARRGYCLEDVAQDIRMVLEHGIDHVRFLTASAEAVSRHDPHADEMFAALPAAEAGAEAYGYVPGDAGNLEDEEYAAAMALLGGLREAASAISEIETLLKEVSGRMAALSEARAAAHSRGGWRPTHGPTETLWHASAHARETALRGFERIKPAGRRGLGAFGDLPHISFTFEKELAENIADTMRELWDIVHGRITAGMVAALVREEGIDRKCRIADYVGPADLDSLRTAEDAVRLYRVYLALSERKDNPVFVAIEEFASALKGIEREDIGVLECQVSLDDSVEFVLGECEFRVPPDRVLDVALHRQAGPDEGEKPPAPVPHTPVR